MVFVLSNKDLWEEDLTNINGLCGAVLLHYNNIENKGVLNALKESVDD